MARVWMVKEEDFGDDIIVVFSGKEKPEDKYNDGMFSQDDGVGIDLCIEEFSRVFPGLTLPSKYPVEVDITIKVVENDSTE